jgi:hypothetical protein
MLSLIAGLGVGLHLENKRKKYFLIFLMAGIATCIDMDHLLPIYQETGVKILHNVFVFIVLPVSIFLALVVYEWGKGSTIKQRSSLLLCVMFLGHMFLDAISDSNPLFYPFRTDRFTVSNMGIAIDSPILSLTSEQVLLMIWGLVIFGANIVETLTYRDVEQREQSKFDYKSYRNSYKSRKSWVPDIIYGKSSLKEQNLIYGYTFEESCQGNESELINDDVSLYIFNFVDSLSESR